ncbi:HEAT repeat domain-containing protein [Streptomyces zingiberis]|uniref:HEAT repeat domain-containing protein n=1 Tax=Streptomyces zingiberis TaxID=2053010 RepID=UPI001F112E71|nr:HEAT repeat domain-containing protein [Streptomyces zingiberis]
MPSGGHTAGRTAERENRSAFGALLDRTALEAAGTGESGDHGTLATLARKVLAGPDGSAVLDELAAVLTRPGQPLWARELAAFALGCRGDRRAFETLVLLLNHRDPARCATAAHALARLRDPRTARAAAALATNPLRTAYALHPVRLLTALRAPESVPALITTLERLVGTSRRGGLTGYRQIALACVEGLAVLGDRRAIPVLNAAREHPRLAPAASAALGRLTRTGPAGQPVSRPGRTGRTGRSGTSPSRGQGSAPPP